VTPACLVATALLVLTTTGGCSGSRTQTGDAVVEIEEIERGCPDRIHHQRCAEAAEPGPCTAGGRRDPG